MSMVTTPRIAPAGRTAADRYARCIEVSKRIRWDVDRDVIQGRRLDLSKRFLPNGLSRVEALTFLGHEEARHLSQIQGRTYANLFRLIERCIAAKAIDLSQDRALGDPTAFEALVRFADEALKHLGMFERVDAMAGEAMPAGYTFVSEPDAVASAARSRSAWSVLALTCHVELSVVLHYLQSIYGEQDICPLWKDVFLFHAKEASQHAILVELEWAREHARLTQAQRDAAVEDLIALVGAVDRLLRAQAKADADCFIATAGRAFGEAEQAGIRRVLLGAYRWQHIVSGMQGPQFGEALAELATPAQRARIGAALAPIVAFVTPSAN